MTQLIWSIALIGQMAWSNTIVIDARGGGITDVRLGDIIVLRAFDDRVNALPLVNASISVDHDPKRIDLLATRMDAKGYTAFCRVVGSGSSDLILRASSDDERLKFPQFSARFSITSVSAPVHRSHDGDILYWGLILSLFSIMLWTFPRWTEFIPSWFYEAVLYGLGIIFLTTGYWFNLGFMSVIGFAFSSAGMILTRQTHPLKFGRIIIPFVGVSISSVFVHLFLQTILFFVLTLLLRNHFTCFLTVLFFLLSFTSTPLAANIATRFGFCNPIYPARFLASTFCITIVYTLLRLFISMPQTMSDFLRYPIYFCGPVAFTIVLLSFIVIGHDHDFDPIGSIYGRIAGIYLICWIVLAALISLVSGAMEFSGFSLFGAFGMISIFMFNLLFNSDKPIIAVFFLIGSAISFIMFIDRNREMFSPHLPIMSQQSKNKKGTNHATGYPRKLDRYCCLRDCRTRDVLDIHHGPPLAQDIFHRSHYREQFKI